MAQSTVVMSLRKIVPRMPVSSLRSLELEAFFTLAYHLSDAEGAFKASLILTSSLKSKLIISNALDLGPILDLR